MNSIIFSLKDYQAGLSQGKYSPPTSLGAPYFEVDPVMYRTYYRSAQLKRRNLPNAYIELRKRTGSVYFNKTYPLQGRTLDYSARTFPAYRFILPEVLSEDWLAIVDWGKFQRDHVLHQPLCGYIVLKLLGGDGSNSPLIFPNGKTLLETCVDSIIESDGTKYLIDFLVDVGISSKSPIRTAESEIVKKRVWKAFFIEAAYIAAVFHDLGYPWQYAERVQGNLDGMNSPSIRQNRSSAQIVDQYGHRLFFHALNGYHRRDSASPSVWDKHLNKLIEAALTNRHGLSGALGFLFLNDCLRRYPSPNRNPLHLLCVEWVALAIMMHDMRDIYWGKDGYNSGTPENPFLRIGFRNDPLSTLVTLVDVIQEFERPAVAYGYTKTKEKVTLRYQEACSQTEFEIDDNGILHLRYTMKTPEDLAIKRLSLGEEQTKYFDTRSGYLDLSSLGIEGVEMTAL
ncbi:hypothetical protein MASR1M36_07070 [Candidatus Cloacimonadaceae bacterium]